MASQYMGDSVEIYGEGTLLRSPGGRIFRVDNDRGDTLTLIYGGGVLDTVQAGHVYMWNEDGSPGYAFFEAWVSSNYEVVEPCPCPRHVKPTVHPERRENAPSN